jgi:hypothetical protein
VNTLFCLAEWKGKQRISPPGDNFTPMGQNSPLGDNFAPGGQCLPLGAKLRMGLWYLLSRDNFTGKQLLTASMYLRRIAWYGYVHVHVLLFYF